MFRFARLLSLAGGALALVVLLAVFARAEVLDPGWLTSTNLSLQKESVVSAPPPSINGNIDCFQESNLSCAVNTVYGLVSTGSEVKLTGTSSYLPVDSYIDNHQHFIAVSNSDTAITYTTEPPYGFYLYFNSNFSSSISLSNPGIGARYQINRPPDAPLTDKDGHRLAADYGSLSFSENGQWMVVSEPNVAVLRVNLQTFQVTPFAPGFNYTIGLDPGLQTAISNDGRYAIVASKNFDRFAIYDLNTCPHIPTTITGPVACQSRDLQNLMKQQVNSYINTSNIRFISDDAIGLYATYGQGATHATAKFILSTAAGVVHQLDYLALGDSYISGEGAFDYQPGTDTDDNTCHVSLISYPYLLGRDLNYNSYHSTACSGATTDDIINVSLDYKGQDKNKIKRSVFTDSQIDSIINNFQPGYVDQLDFVSTYQSKAISLSVGGNDIGFSAKLRSCLSFGTCYSTYEDRLEFVREVNNKFPTLVGTYSKVKNAGAPDARIYIIGYPQIAKVGGDCALNVHMNNDELSFAQQAIDYLDAVVKAAAAKAGVTYVDAQDALNGHRLCEAQPGSVAMNGVTAGNDFPDKLGGPIGRESYHPNELGHELLEQAILSKTQKMTEPNPQPDLTSAPPPETGLEILNAPHSGRPVNVAEFDPTISDDVMFKQALNDVSVSGSGHALTPSATFQASLHSDPVSLGSFSTSSTGNLIAHLVIPEDVPPGYHTLHFYGTDITGQPIDIYKVVYVADSPTDWDGNGLPDAAQACVGVATSGQDIDQDGIDDSCDGQINPAPTTPTQVEISGSVTTSSRQSTSPSPTIVHSQKPATKTTHDPEVLADNTTHQPSSSSGQVQLFGNSHTANLGLLLGTNLAGVSLAISYALWKFWG